MSTFNPSSWQHFLTQGSQPGADDRYWLQLRSKRRQDSFSWIQPEATGRPFAAIVPAYSEPIRFAIFIWILDYLAKSRGRQLEYSLTPYFPGIGDDGDERGLTFRPSTPTIESYFSRVMSNTELNKWYEGKLKQYDKSVKSEINEIEKELFG